MTILFFYCCYTKFPQIQQNTYSLYACVSALFQSLLALLHLFPRLQSLSHVQLFATPWTIALRCLCLWNFLGKNSGLGYHSLLQGISLAQGQNPGLLHCRQILYCLSHKGSLFHDSDLPIFLLQILITTLGPPREFRIISISKSLTLSYLESSFMLCKVTY